jgi:hypothetical protein
VTATGYFMLHGLSDETASIPLKLINFSEEIRRQCDGDSLCGWHSNSMTHSMIIFNPGSFQFQSAPSSTDGCCRDGVPSGSGPKHRKR